MENQNDEMKNENVELGNEEADELSCEEFEEEDNLYEDENLVSNEDIELFNKHFEVQIVKDIKPEDMMDLEVDPNQEELNFKREYDEFQTDGEIYSIAMNEKGVLVIGDGEDTTYFYDLNKKGLIRKEKMNKDSLVTVAFSFDNKLLATACLDGTVNIFDGEEFKLLNTVNGSFSDINWLQWHPKGPVFAFGSVDGSVWVYHAVKTDTNMSFFGHTESVAAGSFTPDGKYLITASEDLTTKVWDLKNQSILYTIKGKKYHQAPICTLAVAKNKSIVATGSIENEIAVANYENSNILTLVNSGKKEHSIEAIEFSNDDKFVIYAGTENFIQILDLSTLQIRTKIPLHEESISKMVSSKLTNYLVYMSTSSGKFLVFDIRGNGSISQTEQLHTDVLIDFVVTKDETFALTASLDKTINSVQIFKI